MAQYTIAERQALKDALADEKFFDQDLQLFGQMFPHHVLIGECKRVNSMNRLSLDRRMIYLMLTRIDQAQIKANRSHDTTKSQAVRNVQAAAVDIAIRAKEWIRGKYQEAKACLSGMRFSIRKPDC